MHSNHWITIRIAQLLQECGCYTFGFPEVVPVSLFLPPREALPTSETRGMPLARHEEGPVDGVSTWHQQTVLMSSKFPTGLVET